jgi:hypothetical protein
MEESTMPTARATISPDDILYDVEGMKKAESRIARFFARTLPLPVGRNEPMSPPARIPVPPAPQATEPNLTAKPFELLIEVDSNAPTVHGEHMLQESMPCSRPLSVDDRLAPGQGRRLILRCGYETCTRYNTLLFFESKLPAGADYGFLISPACQIMESELDRLLVTPALRISTSLIKVLKVDRKATADVKILESAEKTKATIGTQVILLRALERARKERMRPILKFLANHFEPRYTGLLEGYKLADTLDQVRTRFRNPACHGTKVFDAEAYEQFARLAVANRLFHVWDEEGTEEREPSAKVGVFHHHLQQLRF